jgi:hypothetical protein
VGLSVREVQVVKNLVTNNAFTDLNNLIVVINSLDLSSQVITG